jgi:hypothetical protein
VCGHEIENALVIQPYVMNNVESYEQYGLVVCTWHRVKVIFLRLCLFQPRVICSETETARQCRESSALLADIHGYKHVSVSAGASELRSGPTENKQLD